MKPELPVWRSLLYVPVNVEKFVEKAHTRGADVIQLDLEDAVPPAEKEKARALVEKNAARVRRGGADCRHGRNTSYLCEYRNRKPINRHYRNHARSSADG